MRRIWKTHEFWHLPGFMVVSPLVHTTITFHNHVKGVCCVTLGHYCRAHCWCQVLHFANDCTDNVVVEVLENVRCGAPGSAAKRRAP